LEPVVGLEAPRARLSAPVPRRERPQVTPGSYGHMDSDETDRLAEQLDAANGAKPR
jgi:hypothetical protein